MWRLVCISRELQRQCNPASQPNKTCCDEPSSYFPLTLSLSCSLPTLSLFLRLLLLKQTNRRISTDDVLLQAASFNGRSMAFARDPSLSTVHTSNYEIILVDVHATNKQLQTVQHACMRASLFSLANSANTRMCFIEPEARQPRSRGALSFRATLGVLALRAALLTSLWSPEIEFAIVCRTELRSWQTPLACLARDWLCSCLDGFLRVPCQVASEPFVWRLRAALLAHDLQVRSKHKTPRPL